MSNMDAYSDPECQKTHALNRQWDLGFHAGYETGRAELLTSNELYEIVRGTGYVTRDQACEIVDLILQAEKKE